LLLVRTGSLLDAVIHANVDPRVHIRAVLQTAAGTESHVFATGTSDAGLIDGFFLPLLEERVEIHSASQPMTLLFERQLRLADVLTGQALALLAILGAAFVLIPLLLIRHFKALERADAEHQRSAYLATHDVLTDLPNRYLFAERFEQALSRWKGDRVPFAVLLIDLDHFKDINDRYGHEVGDQVLRALASRMLGATRTGDTVARYGGDEFVVLVTDLADPDMAEVKASKMFEAIGQSIVTSAGEISLSCSIGIALCPLHGQTLDTLLKAADQAMYGVKQLGRKGIAVTRAL
jgi:diguanylate cyclase (GGDEF)-like protein